MTCRHFVLATAIHDDRVFSAQTFGCTHSIHGGVATAYDEHVLAVEDRCVGGSVGGVHEIHAREVLVGGHNAVEVLTGDTHEPWQTCSRGNKDSLVAVSLQIIDGNRLADNCIGDKLHAQGAQTVDLLIHNRVRQTVLGYTVLENSANGVQRLEHGDPIAVFSHVTGKGEAGRTRAYHSNL